MIPAADFMFTWRSEEEKLLLETTVIAAECFSTTYITLELDLLQQRNSLNTKDFVLQTYVWPRKGTMSPALQIPVVNPRVNLL